MQEKLARMNTTSAIHPLGTIFKLHSEIILERAETVQPASRVPYLFKERIIQVPVEIDKTYSELAVLTNIRVFRSNIIGLDESPLTIPLKLTGLNPPWPQQISFKYETGRNPGLEFKILN